MISSLYSRWINDWENRLCFRSNNRVIRPFEWGLEWVDRWNRASEVPKDGLQPAEWLLQVNRHAIAHSDDFFGYEPPSDFRLENGFLRFSSALPSPYPANNVVHAQWFPAERPNGRAVIVLPHWNASQNQHGGLCRGIAKFGISAIRLSLPYHDFRMPAELRRADFAVSSNVGRTLEATRQAVVDIRSLADWLTQQGYHRIGICGTSLGSCYACLASSHDPRIKVNVFNHCATYVADVVWTGLSTIHVREGFKGHLDLDELRQLWNAISPVNYLHRLEGKRSLFVYTAYDTTFLPRFSRDVITAVREAGLHNKVVVLPCGHYTMGEAPFKFMDGYHIVSFLKRNL